MGVKDLGFEVRGIRSIRGKYGMPSQDYTRTIQEPYKDRTKDRTKRPYRARSQTTKFTHSFSLFQSALQPFNPSTLQSFNRLFFRYPHTLYPIPCSFRSLQVSSLRLCSSTKFDLILSRYFIVRATGKTHNFPQAQETL